MAVGLGLVLLAFILTSKPGSSASTLQSESVAALDNFGVMKSVATHLGDIRVRLLGDVPNGGKNMIVCLNGINPKLNNEWVPTGDKLTKLGHTVAIIDFHSNERTKPKLFWGGITDDDVQRIILENIIRDLLKAETVVLMGKSWGGRQASLFTGRYPDKVSKLCLVCPASSDTTTIEGIKAAGVPTFLAWARDDYVKWYSNVATWKHILGEQIVLQAAEKGGHFILSEFEDPIVNFAGTRAAALFR